MTHERKWYEKPMRMCALQTSHGGEGIGALKVWKGMGFNVEQLMHAIGDGYYAVFEERHEPILSEYLARAHRMGIRIILYVNTHMLGASAGERVDEWSARDDQGTALSGYATFRIGCVNTTWGQWLIESTVRACELGVDGIFSDGPIMRECHCEACRARRPASREPRDFAVDSAVEFMRRLYGAIKAVDPEIICYQNLHAGGTETERFLPYNDLVGSEGGFMFYSPPSGAYLWKPSITAKMLESIAGGKPTVVFCAADQKPWSLYPHAPAETKLLFAPCVANGASVWYGPHFPLKLLKGPSGRAATEINTFLAEHERWYDDTESAARVALMYSPTSAALYRTSTEASDFYTDAAGATAEGIGDVQASFNGFATMLYQSQIPFDVVREGASAAELKRYKCVVLPTCPCLSDEAVARLREYVAGGGSVIAAGDVAFFDEKGELRAKPALADVLGVTFGGLHTFDTHDYVEVSGRSALMRGVDGALFPAPRHGFKVEARRGAKVLGRYHEPMPGRYVELTPLSTPAIVQNGFRKGRALYLAGDFGEFYSEFATKEHRRIVAAAARTFARPRVAVEGGPLSLEVTHRRKRDGSADLVHLVNYTGGMARPLEEVIPLRGLTLQVRGIGKVTSARSLATGRKLKCESAAGGKLVVRLPELAEYDVILLRH